MGSPILRRFFPSPVRSTWLPIQNAFVFKNFSAERGVCSRRKAEELIANGQVEVNGKVVREPGVSVNPSKSKVTVDGKAVFWQDERKLPHAL